MGWKVQKIVQKSWKNVENLGIIQVDYENKIENNQKLFENLKKK